MRDKTRLARQTQAHAGAWLQALPSGQMRTEIPGPEYRALLKWWLGMPIVEGDAGKCMKCGNDQDNLGDHSVCCTKNHIYRRHNNVRDSVAALVRSAGLSCVVEQHFPDGSNRRPGDVCVPRWSADGPLYLDVSCRHIAAPGRPLPPPAVVQQWWRAQERDKEEKYEEECTRLGVSVTPFIMNLWGGIGPQGAM